MNPIKVFLGAVHHNKAKFVKGQECPKDIEAEMTAKGLIAALPEAIKPVAPTPAPIDLRAEAQAAKEKLEAEAKAKAEAEAKSAKK